MSVGAVEPVVDADEGRADARALTIGAVIAPALIALGAAIRPWVTDFTDEVALAQAAATSPDRWRLGALLVSLGFAVAVAVAIAIARAARTNATAMATTGAIGAYLLTHQLGASGQGVAAAADAGNDAVAHVAAAAAWDMPLLVAGLVALGATWIFATMAIGPMSTLSSTRRRLAAALAVVGPLIPHSIGDLLAAGGLAALLVPATRALRTVGRA